MVTCWSVRSMFGGVYTKSLRTLHNVEDSFLCVKKHSGEKSLNSKPSFHALAQEPNGSSLAMVVCFSLPGYRVPGNLRLELRLGFDSFRWGHFSGSWRDPGGAHLSPASKYSPVHTTFRLVISVCNLFTFLMYLLFSSPRVINGGRSPEWSNDLKLNPGDEIGSHRANPSRRN